MSNITTANFFGEEIMVTEVAVEIGNRLEPVLVVPAKALCVQLGLNWGTQLDKLMSDAEDINRYKAFKTDVTAPDGKNYETVVIPYKTLNAFLFSINPMNIPADAMITTRLSTGEVVQESKRDKLIRYQNECTTVLYDYWTNGVAMNFRANPSDLDSQKTYDILKTSRKRYDNMFNGLVASIIDGQGKRGVEFEEGIKEFGQELDRRVNETIRRCLNAAELDLENGQIRINGEPGLRPITGYEAMNISILENCVCDLIGLYRRKELGQDVGYEAILDNLQEYYNDYLSNVSNNVLTLRSTFNRGKGLFAG